MREVRCKKRHVLGEEQEPGVGGANKAEGSWNICPNHIFFLFPQMHQFRGKEHMGGRGELQACTVARG